MGERTVWGLRRHHKWMICTLRGPHKERRVNGGRELTGRTKGFDFTPMRKDETNSTISGIHSRINVKT